MKATVDRNTLLKSLAHVHSVVERRNTIPILSNVLIEAGEFGLRFMATDLDIQLVETAPAHVLTPGATTVSAGTLFDIARKLPDGSQVELSASDGRMTVIAGKYRSQLSTLPREDFPVIAESDLPIKFPLPAATLRQLIDKTRFAISTEETRYYLNGIFLHATDGGTPYPARGGDRRPPARARDDRSARGRGRHARCDRALRNASPRCASFWTRPRARWRSVAQRVQDPLRFRHRHADLQADRRHLPRLQPRHPDCERSPAQARSAQLRARVSIG